MQTTASIPERIVKPAATPSMARLERRYDVDWLRTLALGLLIIYHVAVSFQPWGPFFGFITNNEPVEWLWSIMTMINIWRIPILFLISGMGVRFAMERRNWHQLFSDRVVRILLPYTFGYYLVGPLCGYIFFQFYFNDYTYDANAWHLWFLGNIFVYVLVLLPVFAYLKHRPESIILRGLARLFSYWLGLFAIALPMMLEVLISDPVIFTEYSDTRHGFALGMICFALGFLFISLRDAFWPAVERARWIALALAVPQYIAREYVVEAGGWDNLYIAFESACWMLAVLGFSSIYLNRKSRVLRYLSAAVYPVYILHMPVQYALSYHIMPLDITAEAKLGLLIAGTFAISLLLYEIIKQIKWLRPLFGLKFS